ncbi:hypothetical protein [Mesorhizobium shangrilense]|uniref:Uncharacterized protein n=1 Tax=Mesorhizobium shangrilense TaxID=460060 RepID=A0ABV2D6T2_9HYPH
MSFSTKLSPCAHQTEKEIEKYYRSTPEGSVAVVRRTHGGILTYEVATFGLRRTSSGRINVGNSGDFYMKSGKNCWEPTGQTGLVVPTNEVMAWAKDHPSGEMGYTIYPEVHRGAQR